MTAPHSEDRNLLASALLALAKDKQILDLAPGEMVVKRLHPHAPFYAACTASGNWSLAIASDAQNASQPPVRLEAFTAEFGMYYVLQEGSSRERVRVCVLQCLSERRDIRALFLVVCDAVMRHLDGPVTDRAVASAINSWLGLFRKLQLPSRSSVVGLIGELIFIAGHDDAAAAVRAWHHDVSSTVDFIFLNPSVEIEVKSTTGARRAHTMSLQQVIHEPGVRRYFASVLVDLRSSGVEVADLVESITARLSSDEDVLLLWRGLSDTCGDQLDLFLSQRFLSDGAANSVRLYSVDSVPQPAIGQPVPAGVNDIRFRSDFTDTEQTPTATVFPQIGS